MVNEIWFIFERKLYFAFVMFMKQEKQKVWCVGVVDVVAFLFKPFHIKDFADGKLSIALLKTCPNEIVIQSAANSS